MSEKIARLGIEREPDKMYYIKGGDVWAVPRKQPGKPKGKPEKVMATGIDLDYSKYLYFIDGDGDVARKARAGGGGGRRSKPAKPAKPTTSGWLDRRGSLASAPSPSKTKAKAKTGGKKSGGRKTRAQLEREIDACLARTGGTPIGSDGEDEDED